MRARAATGPSPANRSCSSSHSCSPALPGSSTGAQGSRRAGARTRWAPRLFHCPAICIPSIWQNSLEPTSHPSAQVINQSPRTPMLSSQKRQWHEEEDQQQQQHGMASKRRAYHQTDAAPRGLQVGRRKCLSPVQPTLPMLSFVCANHTCLNSYASKCSKCVVACLQAPRRTHPPGCFLSLCTGHHVATHPRKKKNLRWLLCTRACIHAQASHP